MNSLQGHFLVAAPFQHDPNFIKVVPVHVALLEATLLPDVDDSHRTETAGGTAPLRRSLVRGRMQHGLGRTERPTAARADGGRSHGEKENVGDP